MATQVVDFVPAGYVPKEDVKNALAISDPTIERMARDGRVGSKLVPRQGRKAERMYLATDVERLKREKEKREEIQAAARSAPKLLEAGGAEKAEVVSIKTGFPVSAVRELLEEWAEKREEVGVREKLWLTWDEAAELSGIPVTYVREAAHAGSIKCKRFGRSWRVQRKSLEAFEG
jgi:excisionase family DNA binding protein